MLVLLKPDLERCPVHINAGHVFCEVLLCWCWCSRVGVVFDMLCANLDISVMCRLLSISMFLPLCFALFPLKLNTGRTIFLCRCPEDT